MDLPLQQIIRVRRLAARDDGEWHWFSPPISLTFRQAQNVVMGTSTVTIADAVLESECREAIKHYVITDLHIIEAHSLEEMERVDLRLLKGRV